MGPRKLLPSSELYTRHCRPRIGQLLSALRLDLVFQRAEASSLFYDKDGMGEVEVLDFLGGYGALVFGHNHPELTAVATEHFAAKRPCLAQLSCRAPAALLGARLNEMMTTRTGRSYVSTFASTGAEAVEAAMKHAELSRSTRTQALLQDLRDKLHSVRRGLTQERYRLSASFYELARQWLPVSDHETFEAVASALLAHYDELLSAPSIFVSMERAFHGKTLGAVALTHYEEYRRPFLQVSPRSCFVPLGDLPGLDAAIEAASFTYLSLAVNADNEVTLVQRQHANVSAMFVEPIQGEGGIRTAPRRFLQRCRELASKHGFPLVFDEIQCGMGRTGTFLYSEQLGVVADYYLLSKGLGGGISKISALLVETEQYDEEFGLIHTSTFGEDELSASVALKALEIIERGELMQNCKDRGHQMLSGLLDLQQDFPDLIKDVRGTGLMLGLEFYPFADRRSPTITTLFDQNLLTYVIAGYLLHEHGLRLAPCMSSRAILRIEPPALISAEACTKLLLALRHVCSILERRDGFSLLCYLVGRRAPPMQLAPRLESPPRARASSEGCEGHVAFVGYFVKPEDMRLWDASLAPFTDAELSDLTRLMYTVLEPFLVDEQVVQSVSGRRVLLSVIGIPVDAEKFAELMRGEEKSSLSSRIERAVEIAADRGCSVAALGGFTSIVTGNGLSLRQQRIAITTGNSLTVAMGLDAITEAAASAGIPVCEARFAVIGAAGNIARIYTELLAEQVSQIFLIAREGQTRALAAVAADLYLNAALQLAARTPNNKSPTTGIAGRIAHTAAVRRALEVGPNTFGAQALYAAITEELREHAPVVLTSDLEVLKHANLILGASSSPTPLIRAELLGEQPVVICDLAVPTDVHDDVYKLSNVQVVAGGHVRLPRDPDFQIAGLDLPLGHAYACCCEGLLMGLSDMAESFSCGAITRDQVVQMRDLASLHGFGLSEQSVAARGRTLTISKTGSPR